MDKLLSCKSSDRKTSANVKTAYKRNYLNTEGDIDMSVTGPVFNGSTVFM